MRHDDEYVIANVGDVMDPARCRFNNTRVAAPCDQLVRLTTLKMPKAEMRGAVDDKKLLGLAVMIVLATGDTGARREIRGGQLHAAHSE